MEGAIRLNPRLVVERLEEAFNDHDVDALVECVDSFYYGEEPVHPDRAFRGREKMREQWASIFSRVPHFKAKVVRCAAEDDIVWSEWHWYGARADNRGKLDMRGVIILGLRENRILWSRVYMEPVQVAGAGLEAMAD